MKEDIVKQLGQRIRALRKKYKLTQEELAGRSRISLKYIQNLEGKNPQNPSLEILQKLSDGFGIPLWQLLKSKVFTKANRISLSIRTMADTILQTGNLSLNTKTYEVKKGGKTIYLPEKQFVLLKYLLIRKNKIMSKAKLTDHLWGNKPVKSNALEVLVRRLRISIDLNYKENLIETVHGIGYRIRSI